MCHLNPSGSENELNSGIGRFAAYTKRNWKLDGFGNDASSNITQYENMFVKIWGKSKTIIVWYVGMSFCPCYLIIQTQEGLTIETSCQVMYERKYY